MLGKDCLSKAKGDVTMKQLIGLSKRGDLQEALKGGKISAPELLVLMSNADQFEEHVAQLEAAFPGVPSIGCINMGYDRTVVEKGVMVVAYTDGITAAANVFEQVSTMPVKYIRRLQKDLETVKPSSQNTVCINFCTGNDACVLTTMYSVLQIKKVALVGGTGDVGKVSANGRIYEDASAYAVLKNNPGKIKIYKENIYQPCGDYRLIASKTKKNDYIIGELNGRPAKQVYTEILQIDEKEIESQTFKNPFGKISGNDTGIVSVKKPVGNALSCFRAVNDSDVLTILEAKDTFRIVGETIAQIRQDFSHISAVFSINCLFRYLYFQQNGELQQYLDMMSTIGNHGVFFGYGENYNDQFLNQTMTCVVFE